jgi:hypothetical protein
MIRSFAMPSALAARPPRFLGAVPVALLHQCATAETVIAELQTAGATVEPVAPTVYSTLLDVPKGEWLLWPGLRSVMWIGARDDALPRAVRERVENPTDGHLSEALDRLASAGVWVREAAALIDGEWGRPARADGVLALLGDERLAGLSGVFLDRAGDIARLHIAAGGVCWTDRPARAIQWFLKAYDLPTPI